MSYGFKIEIWGNYACFSRPELKVERVSYEIMTPSAARGILEAVLWKPAMRYIIDEIAVCAPIRFENIRRNEVNSKASAQKPFIAAADERAQRAAMVLRNVRYVVGFHFELTTKAGENDNEVKFAEMLRRRLKKGQNYHTPYLGVREFPAQIRLIETGEIPPLPISESRSLGLMLYDIDFVTELDKNGAEIVTAFNPKYFLAEMQNGIVDLRNTKVMQ
jgi:CRISPR-associated protein Cas5d